MQFRKISQFAESKINLLSQVLGVIAISALVAMMLLTVFNIFMRAFFNSPIPGDVELIEVGMVCVGFLGLAWCAIKGMHIRVDLAVSFLPKRARDVIDCFGYLIGLGICMLLAWSSLLEGVSNREMNNLSDTLNFPMFPFYWVTALGFAILCLPILVFLFRSFSEAIKR